MLNKIQIIGYLGRDPEVRYLPSGAAVCNFSVATTEKWKDASGNPVEETEWHRVSAFERLAEVCGEYLHKGSLVFIEGKLKTRKYQDKDGVEKTSTEIVAREMKMLGGRSHDDSQDGGQQQPQRQQPQGQQRDGGGGQGYAPQPQRQQPQQRQQQPQQQQRTQGYAPQPQQRQQPQQAPRQAQAPGSGFDDMDDDIPF